MRLIDANAAKRKIIEEIKAQLSELNDGAIAIALAMARMFDCEDDFPTIEAEPVIHSKWISMNNSSRKFCESCGAEFNIHAYKEKDYRFCSYCGAKMDGGENGS